jgi:hypothetical protein
MQIQESEPLNKTLLWDLTHLLQNVLNGLIYWEKLKLDLSRVTW